jgi:adenylate cyclase
LRFSDGRIAAPAQITRSFSTDGREPVPQMTIQYKSTLETGAIIEWLLGDDGAALDEAASIARLGSMLSQAGAGVDRLGLFLHMLDPEIAARGILWSPGGTVETRDWRHEFSQSPGYAVSPIRVAMDQHQWMSARLDDPRYPTGAHQEAFGSHGMTELSIWPLLCAGGPIGAIVFATRRMSGFTTEENEAFRRIVPALRAVSEIRALRRSGTSLMDTYIGPLTSRRILAGHVRRGDVEQLEAALLLCDLRDFTALSNRLSEAAALQALNIYFDQVIPAIESAGGEILKFMGDAVLAFFGRVTDPATSCRMAFDAARIALARIDAIVVPDADLNVGIALHHGTVSYGNIGSGHRLDFTMIGPDVNLVSRIQSVCALTGEHLLMSARFARMLGREDLESLGQFPLKGFEQPQDLFVWRAEEDRGD